MPATSDSLHHCRIAFMVSDKHMSKDFPGYSTEQLRSQINLDMPGLVLDGKTLIVDGFLAE